MRGRGRRGTGKRYFSEQGSGRRSDRGGDEGRESNFSSWTSQSQTGNRDRPPPGLRGKDIGLYYRDRARDRYKQRQVEIPNPADQPINVEDGTDAIPSGSGARGRRNKECVMNLNIPDGVIKRVEKLIQYILSLRSDELSVTGVFKRPPNYIKEKDPFEDDSNVSGSMSNVSDINQERNSYKIQPIKHEGQQYKYGYYDLINGSFEEKLEECLSKYPTVNKSPELDKLSEDYYRDFLVKSNSSMYKRMLEFRKKLPAYKIKNDLLNLIDKNQVIVISGETGCGKSTQVPQIILDDSLTTRRGGYAKVLVTQPRRIAASSLAVRVAEERGERLGESVGYMVRLERRDARARGSITYCTTGVLLTDLEVKQSLPGVTHVVLDEVHERDCHVDLAMCMIKQVIAKRKDLKLILMSATLDAESLSRYFGNCPTMHIEGLAYPVKDVYLEEILRITDFTLPPENNTKRWKQWHEEQKDMEYVKEFGPILNRQRRELGEKVYRTLMDRRIEDLNLDLIFDLLCYICNGPEGAVLIFLPGFQDITKLLTIIENSHRFPSDRYTMIPLHSKLPSEDQNRIFNRPPHGVRKIVIATNIAETSITIDDVVYVIDCGKIKLSGLSSTGNISTLGVEWISQANLRQRRGRAGRVQAGVCYHLVSSFRAARLPERLLPEVQRSNLLEPVLTLKRLRLGLAAEAFGLLPDPPKENAVKWAVGQLVSLGALNESEILTPLGWHLARLPVHPAAGKLLLFGALFGCLDRAASVAAAWGFKDPFMLVIGKEKEADAAKSRLACGEPSDHFAIAEAVHNWETLRDRNNFAWENFLSTNTLKLLSDLKRQFADNMKGMGFLPGGDTKSRWENRNDDNASVFKAVVAAALYPQIGTVRWIGLHRPNQRVILRTPEDGRVEVHPSSVLSSPPSHGARRNQVTKKICDKPGANWHVYWLKQKSTKLYLHDVTLVHTMPLLFFGELHITDDPESSENCLIDICSVKVRCKKSAVRLLVQLRNLLDEVLAAKVATPGGSVAHGQFEENVLNAVIEIITAEDEQTYYADSDDSES